MQHSGAKRKKRNHRNCCPVACQQRSGITTPLFVIKLPDSQPIAAATLHYQRIRIPASNYTPLTPYTPLYRHSGASRNPQPIHPVNPCQYPRRWPHRRRPYPKLNAPTPITIISMDMPFIAKARGVSDSSSSCQRTRDSSVDITNTNSGRVANAAATSDAGPRL